jgi:hypothetical protein
VHREDIGHVPYGQPFRKGDPARVDIAACQPIDDLERAERPVEPVLTGLQTVRFPAPEQRRAQRQIPFDNASVDETAPDLGGYPRREESRRTVRRPRTPCNAR